MPLLALGPNPSPSPPWTLPRPSSGQGMLRVPPLQCARRSKRRTGWGLCPSLGNCQGDTRIHRLPFSISIRTCTEKDWGSGRGCYPRLLNREMRRKATKLRIKRPRRGNKVVSHEYGYGYCKPEGRTPCKHLRRWNVLMSFFYCNQSLGFGAFRRESLWEDGEARTRYGFCKREVEIKKSPSKAKSFSIKIVLKTR